MDRFCRLGVIGIGLIWLAVCSSTIVFHDKFVTIVLLIILWAGQFESRRIKTTIYPHYCGWFARDSM